MDEDGANESYTVRLANTSTPEVCETEDYSQTACGIVIEFVDIVEMRQMNITDNNAGGWKETRMVTYLNSDFYNKLPNELQDVIIPTYPIVSGSGGVDVNITNSGVSENITITDTTKNKIYLLSTREVGFNASSDNKRNTSNDTRILDYYSVNNNNNSRIKKNLINSATSWWLRSANSYGYGYFYSVNTGGNYYANSNGSRGVSPTFRIGTMPTFTVSFDTDEGSSVTSQTITYGEKATRPTTDPTKTGYTFDDWYTTDQYTTKFDFDTPITSNITIYAKFDELNVCADNENITTLSSTTCSNNENITVGDGIVCKRAIKLHEETCSQRDGTYYCSGAGYTTSGSKGTSTITYGSCGTSGTLTSGDAFTCDVNGDGTFNELTERFYYVSDYYDTSTKTFDDSTAVLIYYNNVTSGISCNYNNYAYDSGNKNYRGPKTASLQLPKKNQWSNVELKNSKRQILTEINTLSTTGGLLPIFDYSNYSSRLLTYQEIKIACGDSKVNANGYLDNCNYVMENLMYSSIHVNNLNFWLETSSANDSYYVWGVSGVERLIGNGIRASSDRSSGTRPAIEVPKTQISY